MKPRMTSLAAALAAAAITTVFAQATIPANPAPPPLFDQVTAKEYGTPAAPAQELAQRKGKRRCRARACPHGCQRHRGRAGRQRRGRKPRRKKG